MGQSENLTIAEYAVQYTVGKMTKGASNKPIDLAHSDIRRRVEHGWTSWLRSNDLTTNSVKEQRAKQEADESNLNMIDRILGVADTVESSGIGNCGEQSCVAFKYLWNRRNPSKNFVMVNLGRNHTCIVVGATQSQVDGWSFVGMPPAWPADAVVCDPWFYEWFEVSSDWTRKVRQILAETEPNFNHVQVKVSSIAGRAWINNPLWGG